MDFSSQLLEAVTAYAIDDPSSVEDDEGRKTVLSALGLDNKRFFKHLYVRRPENKQAELRGYIEAGSRLILVYGFPGVGKTSFVASVLDDIGDRVQVIRVDFKRLEALVGELLELDVQTELNSLLVSRCKSLLMSWGFGESDVVTALLESPERDQKSDAFSNEEFSLFSEYTDELRARQTAAQDVSMWVRDLLAHADRRIAARLREMAAKLSLVDLMYAVYRLAPEKSVPVLLFDNIDSIHSDETRVSFNKYVRRLHATIGPLARVIVAARTPNLVQEDLPDFGTHLVDGIEVDYKDFIDDAQLEKECSRTRERQGYCSALDRMRIEERLGGYGREQFAQSLLEKRNRYLDERLTEGISLPLEKENLARIRRVHSLAMRDPRIFGTALELANLDRREMLMHISNFTRFMTEDVGARAEGLGLTEEQRFFVLESYFYHWINDRGAILGTETYDVVQDWMAWHAAAKKTLGCSLTHLIIGAIYNLTGRIRGKHEFVPRTRVADVIERLAQLGYSDGQIRSRILEMYKHKETFIGLLETERFYKVKTVNDLRDEDAIWLTSRATHLCEYLSLKLLFVLSQLRKDKYIYRGRVFSFEDSDPITMGSLAGVLSFLCRLAEMHVKGLAHVKEQLKGESWLDRFQGTFCIRARDDAALERPGDLLFENVLDSHIKFLRHQSGIPPWEFILRMGVVRRFERLQVEFRKDLSLLTKGTLDLSFVQAEKYEDSVGLAEMQRQAEGHP